MQDVEKKLINFKLNLLDETYTFNCDLFSVNYLISLHKFLFQDIYEHDYLGLITINDVEYDYLEILLKDLETLCRNKDIDKILNMIEAIWHYQPFIIGNTRTMIAYLKIINECFLLDIPVDVNSSIESSPKMFKLQHMLTKKG